ncbi:MAG: FolC bifunctional protein [Caulobacteraceae bacterium]|nr:FolC bifunctional protein [Caulobacteraceae bacterium]
MPPVIHVAGTNGKGSTIAYLRAMAEAADLRVHVFTSPHLVRFAERVRLAGRLISDQALAELLARAEAANAGEPITFFEITAAAALLAFAETPADLCLIEVGLGGRYDATNVVRPALSVIAPVALDHREFLGDSLSAIAGEKAGIIKPGVPVVCARQADEAMAVIEAEATRLSAPLTVMGQDFDAWSEHGRLVVQMHDRLLDLPLPSLAGPHQIDNAGLAVMAAGLISLPAIPEAAIAQGVREALWPARMQRLRTGPLAERATAAGAELWLDGGHNPHAAGAAALALGRMSARDGARVVLIVGMLANKDAAGFFSAFSDLRPQVFTTSFDAPTAADPVRLAAAAQAVGLAAQACGSLDQALDAALADGGRGLRVTIIGSLYLAGEVLARSPETWPV